MNTTKTEMPILVSSVMQRQPISLLESDTIQDAVDKMSEHHVSALAIVNPDNVLVGIVSVNDLLRLVQSAEQSLEDRVTIYDNCLWLTELIRDMLGEDEVTTAMSASPITARHNDPLAHVAQLMLSNQIHHIPIVDDGKRLVGMVSSIDFVRLAIDGLGN